MGAQLWYHEAPWHEDPTEALKALQARFLAEHYDLATLLPQRLDSARQCVADAEADGDEYGILGLYREQVRLLEDLCRRPIPPEAGSQIEILRAVHADSGEGIGNVLDVTGISDRRDIWTAAPLYGPEMLRLVGNDRPTLAQARDAVGPIHEELHRAECACFPFFEDGDPRRPAGWFFVGNTAD